MLNNIKTITMYLPQYHQIPENDEWWGKGYTDWVAVKSAEKYFDEQIQPRIPMDNNYYDLSKAETLRWQADLMKKYNVYGQCFYHYYFKEGRKILEKPAELLLQNKDIDMPFCFCWANDPWARSWSKIKNTNQWAEKFEVSGEKKILLEQEYGDEYDWDKHFEYLKDFFLDERYIKIDGKPLFIIYRPEGIDCISEMIQYFNNKIREYGISEICFWGANISTPMESLQAAIYIHASSYFNLDVTGMCLEEKRINDVKTYGYDDVWANILNSNPVQGMKTYFGGIVDQDDTPRRGRLGFCLTGVTPEKFRKYIYELALKNMKSGNEFLFIDAWNEWGEGNYLEPDKKNKFKYLESIRDVMQECNFLTHIDDLQIEHQNNNADRKEVIKKYKKYKKYYEILDGWMLLKENGISVYSYFQSRGYNKIAIYGFMSLGSHLLRELQNTNIEVMVVIDKRSELKNPNINIISPNEQIPKLDAIIITPVYDFNSIKDKLKNKTEAKIVSIEEVINECILTLNI